MLWLPASATRRLPLSKAITFAGNRNSVGSGSGATYGDLPRVSVPFASCSAINSASSASSACCVPLAGVLRHDVPVRIHQHQRRPSPRRVVLPRHQLRIIQHRMPHLIPRHRSLHRGFFTLMRKLRRMHPHDDERIAVLVLQRPQLVQHMQTVHTTKRPEVQEQEPPPKVSQSQLPPTRIKPPTTLELRRTHMHAPSITRPAHAPPHTHVLNTPAPGHARSFVACPRPARRPTPPRGYRRFPPTTASGVRRGDHGRTQLWSAGGPPDVATSLEHGSTTGQGRMWLVGAQGAALTPLWARVSHVGTPNVVGGRTKRAGGARLGSGRWPSTSGDGGEDQGVRQQLGGFAESRRRRRQVGGQRVRG